ncbi:MAG: tetratricopeptide repeat protein [Pseudomonadota bacterium]
MGSGKQIFGMVGAVSVLALAGANILPDNPASASETAQSADAQLVEEAGAPLFEGMGSYHRTITTSHPGAQRYFNQGMVMSFGFNHAEAIRSFRAAQRLDPNCAMCFWGEALATGPNINIRSDGQVVMQPAERVTAHAAITKALALRDYASAAEQKLIEAQAARYNGDPESDRAPLDRAYADAMASYVATYPDDDDAGAIYAESLMNLMPWDYWSDSGAPKDDTRIVVSMLEQIIERSPDHPLALHLYIHAVEASEDPGVAEDEADRLLTLVPGSGHLVHMPSHIYWRIGRYDDAAKANIMAAAVDEAYIAACNAQGFYPALYYPHNIHFLWAATSMSGQSEMAIDSANKLATNVRMEQIEQFPTVEFFKTIPILTMVQFGKWDAILAETEPPTPRDYSRAIANYARGVAFVRTGQSEAARAELEELASLKDTVQIQFLDNNAYPASTLLNIAHHLLAGELALDAGQSDEAIAHFEQAVELQDGLPYTEPPFWYYPTRHTLGQALLAAGKPAEAEAVYLRDLKDYPRNGWSMAGLIRALEAQGKDTAEVEAKFAIVWANADIELTQSRF